MSQSRSTERSVSRARFSAAICGNPNCGKTTIFNALTGMRQRVGNFPGVTVENVTGEFTYSDRDEAVTVVLQDVPGSYSLAAFSPDEYIAAQALFGQFAERPPDVIVCTIDATNLERGLYLLFQVLEIGRPVVVALNMIDLAERRGIHIDEHKLSQLLGGVPVVPMVANRGRG
ncbi:MAG: ferrous iron transport protein B, partial [Candidatus Zixiibacteriota bacterium]